MYFEKYLSGLTVNQSNLTDEDIGKIESEVGFVLPENYKEFLTAVDGCEGLFGGKNYAIMWKGQDLGKYNREYEVSKFAEGMLLFGSDGGGEAFAFDSMNDMAIVRIPFVGMERDLSVLLAKTFDGFLSTLCEKDLYE